MNFRFSNLKTIIITVVITAAITNALKDVLYFHNYGNIAQKAMSVAKILEDNSFYEIDRDKMADFAAGAIAESVGDIYTNYFPKSEFTSFNLNISNSYCGIGIVLTVDNDTNKLMVSSVIDNSPAYRAGILKNDYIVAVNDVLYSGDDMNEAISVIRGDGLDDINNTEVILSIQRDNMVTDYTLIRGNVQNDSVTEKMITDDIGYIRISAFNSVDYENSDGIDTYDEFSDALDKLNSSGMNKLIIDLRSNPGGYLNVAIKIADLLLPEGVITYTLSKNNERTDYYSDDVEFQIPIVVLVNESSASASEVLTGALKDYHRAVVIGEKTFGKGVVQKLFEFNDGSGLSVTESKYYTPSGVCIDGIGIEPDIEVPFDDLIDLASLKYEEDDQLKRAVEYLKEEQ